MSVVVRMEMPKSCKKCKSTICLWVKDDDLDYMDVIEKVQDFRKKNNDVGFPDFCPIICQLPDGHGRLIDADAMADDVRILWDYKTVDGITASTVLKQIMTDIGNCPTIVPAEAERSET